MMYLYGGFFYILIPGLLISIYASIKVNTTYSKFSRVGNSRNISGDQAARSILDSAGLNNVDIEHIRGSLTDHYDPRSRVLRLSEGVYSSTSIAAIGIAAHEAGHAIQHATRYAPLAFRNSIVPIANFATNASWIIFIIGLAISRQSGAFMMNLGIFIFCFAVIFHIATLFVEINASRRAVAQIDTMTFGDEEDVQGVKKVLSAAALTYVAALLMAILQLARMILLRNSRQDN